MYKKNYDAAYLQTLQNFLAPTKQRSYELLQLDSKDVLIDIGCGRGDDITQLIKSKAYIIGVDHDEELIAIARKQNPNAEFLWNESNSINLPDARASIIRMDRIFQHLVNPSETIRETNRLLKKGGVLQIVDTDYLSISLNSPSPSLERKVADICAHKRFKGAYLIPQLESYMQQFGFVMLTEEKNNYLITDFSFANYMINFDVIINEATIQKIITSQENDIWQKHRVSSEFKLSINLMIYMFQKINDDNSLT